jgi:hypothetical protein
MQISKKSSYLSFEKLIIEPLKKAEPFLFQNILFCVHLVIKEVDFSGICIERRFF